ncbi:BTB/POZ protein [Rhizophagus irregularis DAOM 181602=DAOM 197198]|nr:hypothetical protein RirG_105700 [Rhizophagus irregularis DAOM 197198w]GBC38387.1 BTB/POZ protein [Rhizophagus irregularis DAOM 181602=DAOM 197198]
MTSEFFPELLRNFSQLLDDADDYNVTISVGENSNTKEFHAHSNILRARSPYFKRALSQNWITKKNNMITFTKPNISPIVFEMIIRYMYTGILDLKKKAGSDILDLLVASDELLIEELVTFVQKYLIENQPDWLQENFVKVLNTVFRFGNYKQLQVYCLESICEDSEPFFNSPEFPTLESSILLGLLKRDDLLIDEIELWNYLIKWGIAQASELEGKNTTNLNRWNKKDFSILSNILNPYIRHIRFFNISSKDFHNSIWPFKSILSKTLFEDIISFHLTNTQPKENILPPRCGKIIDSTIIKLKHAVVLAKWIRRKDANERISKNKCNFNLIYRGSRDGFDLNTIRSKCNGQGACILVIKIRENGAIIGGYNPLGWIHYNNDVNNGLNNNVNNNYNYNANTTSFNRNYNYNANIASFFVIPSNRSNTTESFIFSLGDEKDEKKFKISRVTDRRYAIYESNCCTNIALNFGNGDLVINGTNGSCNQNYYESNILDTNYFSIEEMEIFSFY